MRRMGAALVLALAALGGVTGCGSGPDVSDEATAALVSTLKASGTDPVSQVVSLFEDHDVVLLGEHGLIREDPLFVARVIPALYAAGVRVVATEFACYDDQARIDSLVTSVWYDRVAAVDIQRRYMGGIWPFTEYLDIYQAAWDVNRSRPSGTSPMRVVALSPYVDWERLNDGGEGAEPAQQALVQAEARMAQVVRERVLDRGDKALVYCRRAHAFTDFDPPSPAPGSGGNHLGHLLASGGTRVATVLLHGPWPKRKGGWVRPCDGLLDAAVAALGDSVGFRTTGAAAALMDTRSAYAGDGTVTLGQVCDAYVAHAPLDELTPVTVIHEWIPDEAALERARRRFPDRDRAESLAGIDDWLKAFQSEASAVTRFRDLK